MYHVYDPNANTYSTFIDPQAKLTGDYLLPSLKDNSGNIWLGAVDWSISNGLMKYDGTNWSYPDLDNHNIRGAVYCLAQDTGNTIVFGTNSLIPFDGPIQLTDTTFNFMQNNIQ